LRRCARRRIGSRAAFAATPRHGRCLSDNCRLAARRPPTRCRAPGGTARQNSRLDPILPGRLGSVLTARFKLESCQASKPRLSLYTSHHTVPEWAAYEDERYPRNAPQDHAHFGSPHSPAPRVACVILDPARSATVSASRLQTQERHMLTMHEQIQELSAELAR
jgi:hypothetical protein